MFVKTAATSGFDIAIVGHPAPSFPLPDNVFHIHVTWDELVDRIVDKIFHGDVPEQDLAELRVANPYKSCDYRPFFAYLFPDELQGYQWWGHVDNDSLLGNLTRYIPQEVLQDYDLISGQPGRAVLGPFTMFRNIQKINELWKMVPPAMLKKLLINKEYLNFDEWGQGNKAVSMGGLVDDYADKLRIHLASVKDGTYMWDTGECDADLLEDVPDFELSDDPESPKCGECIYQTHPDNDMLLTRSRDGMEVFMCHYMSAKKHGQEETLADDDKFKGLMAADTFRVTYFHGFDFLEEEYNHNETEATITGRLLRGLSPI